MYEWACMKYVDAFCEKHNLTFYGWVNGRIGEIGQFSEYFFNYSEVMLDVNTQQSVDTIFKWYDAQLEAKKPITYEAYVNGFSE